MRRLIYLMMVSLDGFISRLNGELDWAIIDEELHTFVNDQTREMGAFLYGRRMYEIMVDSWPTADTDPSIPAYMVEFARIWKNTPKIVFSKTLEQAEWAIEVIRENIAEEIVRLKEEPGKDMGLGGADLASTLMRLGLIDEYRLFVHPVILGNGKPMFSVLDNPIRLRLLETRTFGSGVVYLRYRPE